MLSLTVLTGLLSGLLLWTLCCRCPHSSSCCAVNTFVPHAYVYDRFLSIPTNPEVIISSFNHW